MTSHRLFSRSGGRCKNESDFVKKEGATNGIGRPICPSVDIVIE